jgi:hypothetical protein
MAVQFNECQTALGMTNLNEFYPNIYISASTHDTDNVLLSVVRAILNENRMDWILDAGITQMFLETTRINTRGATNNFVNAIESNFSDNIFNSQFLGLSVFFISDNLIDDTLGKISNANKALEGWKPLLDVAWYILQGTQIVVYQNEIYKSTVVIAPASKRFRVMHLLASCISRVLPWAFTNCPLTDDEKVYLKALSMGDYETFKLAMQKIYDAGNFYQKKLNNLVKGFASGSHEKYIEICERNIAQKQEQIDSLMETYRQLLADIELENMKAINARNKMISIGDVDSELLEFLQSNKAVTVLRGDKHALSLAITCFLNDCDEDMFKHYVVSPTSENYVYQYGMEDYDFDLLKCFFMSIWGEHRFNVRVYCEWILENTGYVSVATYTNMGGDTTLTENRIGQPHIDRYGCFSGYKMMFENLAQEGDFVGIVSTMIASSASINWTDSTVVKYFMEELFQTSKKCIEDNDGNLYTVAEVMDILKTEIEKESESNASN